MAILYCWSGAAGSGSGADWANAKTTLTAAFVTEVAGDTIFVAHDHNESTAGIVTLASSGTMLLPTKVICANRAGSVPPVSADRRNTAQVSTTGSVGINITGYTHYDGIIFNIADSTNAGSFTIPQSGTPWLRFDNCSLRLRGSGSTSKILFGSQGSASGAYVELNNTTVSFANVLHGLDVACLFRWRNTPAALLGTMPTNLFSTSAGAKGGATECIGIDLSALGSGKTIVNAATANACANSYRFIDCKLDAAVTKVSAPLASFGSYDVDFVRSGASGNNYTVYRPRMSGELMEETVIVRSGGAQA